MFQAMQPDEISFLARHKIPLTQVHDLGGQPASDCYDEMVAEEKLFGYNAASCSTGAGHKFVTRTGECIQCEPSGARQITAMRRLQGLADVYLLGSISTSMLIVGSSSNADKRVPMLNAVGYGGASDWRKLNVVREIANSGKIEFQAHARLEKYRVRDVSYLKDGAEQQCYDLFSCSVELALQEFQACVPKGAKIASLQTSELAQYVFSDRPTPRRTSVALSETPVT